MASSRGLSVLGFSGATLLSRVLGLVREVAVAWLVGATAYSDAFYVAVRIPMFLRDLFAENAAQTAFVPIYVGERKRSEHYAARLLSAVLLFFLITAGAASLLGVVLAPAAVFVVAPGFSAEPALFGLTVALTRYTFPFLLVVSMAALASAALNARERFFVPALSPAFFNVGVIALALVASRTARSPQESALWLAGGVLCGGALQLLFQLPFLRGYRLRRPLFRSGAFRSFLKLLTPVLVSSGFSRVTLLINTVIASFLTTGVVSFLNYGFRLMQLPLGVFGIAVATVSLPRMSRLLAEGRDPRSEMEPALQTSLFLTLPSLVLLALLALPLVELVYQRGGFDAAAARKTAYVLALYSPAVVATGLVRVYLNYFFASRRVLLPNLSFGTAALLNVAVALALLPVLDYGSLALATGVAGFGQLALLAAAFHHRHPATREHRGQMVRILLSVLPPTLLALAALRWLGNGLAGGGVALVCFAITYAGCAGLLGIRAMRGLFSRKGSL